MFHLNKRAKAIFLKLIDGLTESKSHRKIETSTAFMPCSVEYLYDTAFGRVYSVAHYFELNGDLCCDPDMTFVVARHANLVDGEIYPLTFEMQGSALARLEVSARIDSAAGKMYVFPTRQRDHATFANQWMRNIASQQSLKATASC